MCLYLGLTKQNSLYKPIEILFDKLAQIFNTIERPIISKKEKKSRNNIILIKILLLSQR